MVATKTTSGVINSAPDFISAEQAVVADSQLDVAHGFGGKPDRLQVSLICKTDDIGYIASTNDEILLASNGVASGDNGAVVFFDATNVSIVMGAAIRIIDASTFNGAAITPANWKWIVRAWL